MPSLPNRHSGRQIKISGPLPFHYACPLRARQSGRSLSRTVVNGQNVGETQVSVPAGDQRSLAPTSQAGSAVANPRLTEASAHPEIRVKRRLSFVPWVAKIST